MEKDERWTYSKKIVAFGGAANALDNAAATVIVLIVVTETEVDNGRTWGRRGRRLRSHLYSMDNSSEIINAVCGLVEDEMLNGVGKGRLKRPTYLLSGEKSERFWRMAVAGRSLTDRGASLVMSPWREALRDQGHDDYDLDSDTAVKEMNCEEGWGFTLVFNGVYERD
ncbi:hypothetical protein LIPSTDRAFT_4751 [Lipomyces starkeyi NRRL Y-11557]|uniref:Uncharacterized protein n=1 Tax=Lipomyces starkeyi NRRL Y-11557 TaxID=675824 RepID=A0A1E3Q1T7_LIPST|nr:hypothetical protein LIPSTDRAFT_4751 [Lipomyces starkeyi NRRL Y-11557]